MYRQQDDIKTPLTANSLAHASEPVSYRLIDRLSSDQQINKSSATTDDSMTPSVIQTIAYDD